ncbi:unnamed protein product [Rotaria sp. Silwood1]|nr:unnamed protein product [Rotaria sp. Silwood1]CAF0927500.1 unnamed protein product [Rotaria sp. Silwood1]CAF0959930.1 unnamed protein product [Rotaria sp. Silwood1]CAF3397949.1 unnamed protein product [Rotaria sp. Silwood1]CAF3401413.1 unnamed protein product [Rotaria sp. Silwood1]
MLLINILIICLIVFSNYVHGEGESEGKCDAVIDLSLIIDSSGSISPDDFKKGKEALIDIVSRLNVGVKKAGVALINYASNVSLIAQNAVFEFNKAELLKQIAELPHIRTNTATGDALALAGKYCGLRCRKLMEGIPRIFAIFTDGQSNEGRPVIPAAEEIRNGPIQGDIFAIGIGNISKKGRDELIGIAGDVANVMHIDSYLDFTHVSNAIAMEMCAFPAFILPDVKVQTQVTGNNTRYYKMQTLHKKAKSAFFEIEIDDIEGQSIVYTSTTTRKPTSYSSKSISKRTAKGSNIYTTYVPADAKNFYFTIKGVKSTINKSDFIVHVQPVDF